MTKDIQYRYMCNLWQIAGKTDGSSVCIRLPAYRRGVVQLLNRLR